MFIVQLFTICDLGSPTRQCLRETSFNNHAHSIHFTFFGCFCIFFNLTISSRSALLLASISIHVNTLTQFKDSDYQYQLNIQIFSHRSCIYEAAHRHYISNQITDADHQQTFLQLSRRSYTQFKGTHSLTRNRNAVLFTKQII